MDADPGALHVTKIFQYCTCPAAQVTYNFHSSCKPMHLSFKSVCNKEHKGVICNMTSLSNSSQSTHPTGQVLGKNYSSFLYFIHYYERTSGIFVPCPLLIQFTSENELTGLNNNLLKMHIIVSGNVQNKNNAM